MRAARLHGPGDLRLETVAVPQPGPGEIRLRMQVALVGGTVRKVIARGGHARMGQPPLALGHEGVGVVDAVGEGVTSIQPGVRVAPANSAACGSCPPCRRGLGTQCTQMVWLNGFLAEHLIVPEAIVRGNLHRVPAQLASPQAALAENLACVLKGLDRTPVRAGEHALVIGTGAMGLLWTHMLARRGGRVLCVGRHEQAAAVALAMGATRYALAPEIRAHPPAESDLIIEAVGTTQAWELALELATPGARVHFFGGPPAGSQLAIDAARLHYDELQLSASFHHTPYHFAEALTLLAGGDVPTAPLLGPAQGLEEWYAARQVVPARGVPPKQVIHWPSLP